jgi:carbamate kinase
LKILVALGGNAILQSKEAGTAKQQFANISRTSKELVELFKEGAEMTITHGNGPQVGDILLRNELASTVVPPMPLDVCGAQSQGMIGYMFQQSLNNEFRSVGLDVPIVTILTQTVVDKNDPAFRNPTKPIGPFYSQTEATVLARKNGWIVKSDGKRGYRRVVPSPKPISVVEAKVIEKMFREGFLVIHSGGGGVPVIMKEDGSIAGVEAVIDKDLTSGLMASMLRVDVLLILTDVEKISLNYGKPDQKNLDSLSVKEARSYMLQEQFPAGSMGPKVEAAANFVEASGGKAIITSLGRANEALKHNTGTLIV